MLKNLFFVELAVKELVVLAVYLYVFQSFYSPPYDFC